VVNKARVLAEFLELVQIKSSSRQEREIADALTKKLLDIGLEVVEDTAGQKIGGNAGNLIGYLKGTVANAPVMLLSAHMDSVEPCAGIQPQLKDGIITSAGDTILGSDDKSGVVGILEALRVIKEANIPHGDIQVVFTVSEEIGLSGSRNIDRHLLKADFGYVLDASGSPGNIIIKAPGQNCIEIGVHGKKAHAGLAPEEGINAIILAGKALAELKQGRIDEETTANVGIINGGQATNIVPDFVSVICEARSRDNAKLEAQTKLMCETFERVVTGNGGKVTINVTRAYDPYTLADDDPVVVLACEAANSVGLEPVLGSTGGGSDANFFNKYGVPVAVLGTGMSKVHTTEEFIKEEDLYKLAEWITAIIKTAGQTEKSG